jgi:hypothetical protein
MSIEELERGLVDSSASVRLRAAAQLVGLSSDHRPLMITALQSPDQKVRLAAVNALSSIGDSVSVDLLCEFLSENQKDRDLLIATAEALSKAKAATSIPILREILTKNTDKYVQKYLSRAIVRIENPGFYHPLLDTRYGFVSTNFLLDDVAAVHFDGMDEAYRKSGSYYFESSDWRRIFTLIRRSDICVPGSHILRNVLVVELEDGRELKLYGNQGKFHYMNDSFFFHKSNERICFTSQELAEFIQKRADRE